MLEREEGKKVKQSDIPFQPLMTQSLNDLMPVKKMCRSEWEREREGEGERERERAPERVRRIRKEWEREREKRWFIIVLCNMHANHIDKEPPLRKSTQYRWAMMCTNNFTMLTMWSEGNYMYYRPVIRKGKDKKRERERNLVPMQFFSKKIIYVVKSEQAKQYAAFCLLQKKYRNRKKEE